MPKLPLFFLCSSVIFLSSCSDLGYYVQCASGHLDLMRRCRPIEEVLADPQTPPEQRQQLGQIREAREFASRELYLPDNGSYRGFADLGRPYVVWNIVAAPEFSLEPRQWCFPFAGCVTYRGYFDEATAHKMAGQLKSDGLDVDVYGVQAYSTLRWFDDPVLNTFFDERPYAGVALIFHELAHQLLYVPDDTRFNEAFAVTVEREGLRRWLQRRDLESERERYQLGEQRNAEFFALLRKCRDRLEDLYARPLSATVMRTAKQEILAELTGNALELEQRWGGDGITRWLERGVNNARLASLATYRDLLPAFEGLLASKHGDLPGFYTAASELAALPEAERLVRLHTFLPPAKLAGASAR